MSDKTFDAIRLVAELILPISALITEVWGFAYGVEIAATLVLLDTFAGVFVEVLRKIYKKKQMEITE